MALRDSIKSDRFRRATSRSTAGYAKWHFCRNCSSYPRRDYEEVRYRPYDHDICAQCKRMNDQGRCQSAGGRWFW